MKKIASTILFIFILLSLYGQVFNPEVFSTSGDNYKGENVQLSWTIGEGVVGTLSNSSIKLSQGFHQFYPVKKSISFYTNSDKEPDEEENTCKNELSKLKMIQTSICPNPTHDYIKIEIKSPEEIRLKAYLYDIQGNKILCQNIYDYFEKIDLQDQPNGMYILKIYKKNYLIKSYKIEKID